MHIIPYLQQLVKDNALTQKHFLFTVLLLTCCIILAQPANSAYGSNNLQDTQSICIFSTEESIITRYNQSDSVTQLIDGAFIIYTNQNSIRN